MDLASVENSLQRGVTSQVYLFYGEETYLRDGLIAKFKATLLPPEVQDFNLDVVDGRTVNLADLAAMASTLPFFG
ncbi:MAG TPA: hypothetical protein VHS59_14585 [Bacillota bacterium]|nr:hypothetical protein [Bacillota bacterium]